MRMVSNSHGVSSIQSWTDRSYSHRLSDCVKHPQIVARTRWVSDQRISTVGLALNATWYSLDKMLVDNVGDMTITNDGATILSLLEVTHPAVSGATGDILECVLIEDVGPDLGFACYATGQGGRRWYYFSCTIGFRAAEKSQ